MRQLQVLEIWNVRDWLFTTTQTGWYPMSDGHRLDSCSSLADAFPPELRRRLPTWCRRRSDAGEPDARFCPLSPPRFLHARSRDYECCPLPATSSATHFSLHQTRANYGPRAAYTYENPSMSFAVHCCLFLLGFRDQPPKYWATSHQGLLSLPSLRGR